MKKMFYFLMKVSKLDWKPFAISLFGFVLGTIAEVLAQHYGIFFGGICMLIGWWLVMMGLLLASRKDLSIYEIFNR